MTSTTYTMATSLDVARPSKETQKPFISALSNSQIKVTTKSLTLASTSANLAFNPVTKNASNISIEMSATKVTTKAIITSKTSTKDTFSKPGFISTVTAKSSSEMPLSQPLDQETSQIKPVSERGRADRITVGSIFGAVVGFGAVILAVVLSWKLGVLKKCRKHSCYSSKVRITDAENGDISQDGMKPEEKISKSILLQKTTTKRLVSYDKKQCPENMAALAISSKWNPLKLINLRKDRPNNSPVKFGIDWFDQAQLLQIKEPFCNLSAASLEIRDGPSIQLGDTILQKLEKVLSIVDTVGTMDKSIQELQNTVANLNRGRNQTDIVNHGNDQQPHPSKKQARMDSLSEEYISSSDESCVIEYTNDIDWYLNHSEAEKSRDVNEFWSDLDQFFTEKDNIGDTVSEKIANITNKAIKNKAED